MKLFLPLAAFFLLSFSCFARDETVFVISPIVYAASDNAREMTLQNGNSSEIFLVDRTVLLDATQVAGAEIIEGNHLAIQIRMNAEGKARLAKITADFLNQRLAVILKGRLVAAPKIQSQITGGTLQISGNISRELADSIVAALNKIRRD